MGIALSVSTAAGQATRPAGADSVQRAAQPAVGPAAPSTAPVGQQQGKAEHSSQQGSVEQHPIRRKDSESGNGNGSSAARRDGTGKPVAPPRGSSFELRRVALALGAVIGLIFLLHWLAKRLFPGVAAARSSQAVRVLSRSVLSPKQQVLLLQVGRRVIVVGDSGAQMNPLAQIEDPDEIAALVGQLEAEKRPAVGAFGGFFGKAREPFDKPDSESVRPSLNDDDVDQPVDAVEQEQPPTELGLNAARGEIRGLMEKVRELSQQFHKS